MSERAATLVDRLRGIYRVPINDGMGATGGGLEPDNPDKFVRQFQTPPIQLEAADTIAAQKAEIERGRLVKRQLSNMIYNLDQGINVGVDTILRNLKDVVAALDKHDD